MKLGEFVKEYRDKHDLSQRELALKCNVSNGIISMIEKGINSNTKEPIVPTLPTLKKLADGMQITLEELLEKVENINVTLDYWNEKFDTNMLPKESQAFDLISEFFGEQAAELIQLFDNFNAEGKEKLLDTARDMSNLDRYKKDGDESEMVQKEA